MKKNKSGFTLIELLIVIAIIGVLAAVLIVALGGVKKKAKAAAAKSLLNNIAQALSAYNGVHDAFPSGKDDFKKSDEHGYTGNQNLVEALCERTSPGGKSKKQYLQPNGWAEAKNKVEGLGGNTDPPQNAEVMVLQGGVIELIDPWKFSIRYKSRWFKNASGQWEENTKVHSDYRLMSVGPNRKAGDSDDIYR